MRSVESTQIEYVRSRLAKRPKRSVCRGGKRTHTQTQKHTNTNTREKHSCTYSRRKDMISVNASLVSVGEGFRLHTHTHTLDKSTCGRVVFRSGAVIRRTGALAHGEGQNSNLCCVAPHLTRFKLFLWHCVCELDDSLHRLHVLVDLCKDLSRRRRNARYEPRVGDNERNTSRPDRFTQSNGNRKRHRDEK